MNDETFMQALHDALTEGTADVFEGKWCIMWYKAKRPQDAIVSGPYDSFAEATTEAERMQKLYRESDWAPAVDRVHGENIVLVKPLFQD